MTRATRLDKSGKPAISEKQFLEQVRKAALLLGYKFYHTHDSRHSAAGFPDCVILGKGRLIFAELKTATGNMTLAQWDWIDELWKMSKPVEAYILKPSDFEWFLEVLKR